MLNDWVETPGDSAIGATHRVAGEWPSDPQVSGADSRTGGGHPVGSATLPERIDLQVGGDLASCPPDSISETDLLYWFG